MSWLTIRSYAHRHFKPWEYCEPEQVEPVEGVNHTCRAVEPRDFAHEKTWPIVWALPCFGIICIIWVSSFLIVYCATPKRLIPEPGNDKIRHRAIQALVYITMFIFAPPLLIVVLIWFLFYAVFIAPSSWAVRKLRNQEQGPRGYMHPGMIINRVLFPSTEDLSSRDAEYFGKGEFSDEFEDETLSPHSRPRHSSLPSILEEELEQGGKPPQQQPKPPRKINSAVASVSSMRSLIRGVILSGDEPTNDLQDGDRQASVHFESPPSAATQAHSDSRKWSGAKDQPEGREDVSSMREDIDQTDHEVGQ